MNTLSLGVIGAGSWGTALAMVLAKRLPAAANLLLWGRDPEQVARIQSTRLNEPYLPGVRLDERIIPTDDLAEAAQRDVLLLVTPSFGLRETARHLARTGTRATLVCCTKGIERGSGLRMSQILEEELPLSPVAVLSGPSHAEETASGMPTAVVLGCPDPTIATALQRTFTGDTFRVYTNHDVAGIELGGALKNIFAIAAGVSDGLGFGDNTKAALVTRALAELTRLGVALGGSGETFGGLSGVGDLLVTCFSRHSRNRAVGERLGRGETLDAIAASMQMVAEGVPTTLAAYEQARRHNVETPIIDAIHALLYKGRSPREMVGEMLAREPKAE